MAKFNATVEFSLATEIEPEGVRFGDVEDIEGVGEFDDSSYFGAQNVTADGGSLSFEITAEDEYAARGLIQEVIDDGSEFEDHNGFTWLVEGFNLDLEEVDETPSVDEAIEILQAWVEEHLGEGDGESRVAKAAEVVLQDHANLGRRVSELEQWASGLSARLQAIEDKSSAPTESV